MAIDTAVELVEGCDEHFWPRPGRIFAAARSHTFAQLARAIDDAFARWDRSHLHEFELGDRTRLTTPFEDWDATDQTDDGQAKLSRLQLGERFVYVFDLGDGWTHLCTVATQRVDPLEVLGLTPGLPLPYFGWGDLPDQYRRRWEHDDGESRSAARSRACRPAAAATVVGSTRALGQGIAAVPAPHQGSMSAESRRRRRHLVDFCQSPPVGSIGMPQNGALCREKAGGEGQN